MDELYRVTVVWGTLGLDEVCLITNKYISDGLVKAIGWGVAVVIAGLVRLFDDCVVDGFVRGVGWVIGGVGNLSSRLVHNGDVQEYVAGFVVMAAGLAAMVYIVVLLGW